VIGVDLRAFVALKRMVGKTLQKGVIAPLAEKQGTNVLYNQTLHLLTSFQRFIMFNVMNLIHHQNFHQIYALE